ncbi:hypothetical protein [Agrobacterium sp. CFBP2214]|uniref:hypothetical protein n=1 Tax=Agrobacterium sp. CFBP2214 TaxID=3040274 RepID=UPI000DD33F40|nr:hypothetical protein [Agrobacterium sp. CFBP2214]
MGSLLTILGTIATPLKYIVGEVSKWSERRDLIKEAELKAKLAKITADSELAAYKAKADVEWDLAWAGQAQSSWKDEYILILWTLPMLAFLPALFFPDMREGVEATLQFVQTLGGPDVIYWYMGGWGVIFSATFGMKNALQLMVPGNISKITEAFSQVPDDIPKEVVQAATEKIRQKLADGSLKQGLF